MATILLVYASQEGRTEKVARRIAEHLRGAGHAVRVADVASVMPQARRRNWMP